MADEGTCSISEPSRSPEPEKTGVAPESQQAGSVQVTILPAVRPDDKSAGLQESNVVSRFASALMNQSGQQLAQVVEVFSNNIDRQFDRAHETNEKLQKELRDEQVAHARTEEQLKVVLKKDRTGALLNILGGALLGYGLSDISSTSGKIFSALGFVLLVISSRSLFPWSKE
jgi:hypothetical protein